MAAPPAGAPAVSPSGVPAAAPQAAAAGGVNSFDETRPPIGRRPVAAAAPKFVLVTLLPTGVEANEYNLRAGTNATIGRQGADICFPEDTSLSDRHATIVGGTNGFQVRDEGSAQGVFLQPLAGRNVELARGAIVRAGRQWLVVAEERGAPAVAHYDASGKAVARYPIREGTTVFGRQSPDVTLDAGRRHAVTPPSRRGAQGRAHLAARSEQRQRHPAQGQSADRPRGRRRNHRRAAVAALQQRRAADAGGARRFRQHRDGAVAAPRRRHGAVRDAPPGAGRGAAARGGAGGRVGTLGRDGAGVTGREADRACRSPCGASGKARGRRGGGRAEPAAGGSGDRPSVRFKGHPNPVPCEKGKTICDVAEAAGIHLAADCHQGSCGMDPVRDPRAARNT